MTFTFALNKDQLVTIKTALTFCLFKFAEEEGDDAQRIVAELMEALEALDIKR